MRFLVKLMPNEEIDNHYDVYPQVWLHWKAGRLQG